MKKIGVGRQAEVYIEGDAALKIYNSSVPVENIEYEADLMKKIYSVYKGVPQFYGMWSADGKVGLKLEFIDGNMLSAEIGRRPGNIRNYGREMGLLHREMHSHQIEGLPTVFQKFEWKLRQYKGLDPKVLSILIEYLRRSQGTSLCHGDLHPENIMVDKNGDMRVIDWVDSYCGNPLSDAARTYYLLCNGSSPCEKPLYVRVIEKMIRKIIAREYLKAYFENRAFPKEEFELWKLIIHICRHSEGIKEEHSYLDKVIPLEIKSLMNKM